MIQVDVDGNTFTKVLVGPIEDDKNRTEMLQEIREKIAEDAFLFRL
jgi:hypothetical protein